MLNKNNVAAKAHPYSLDQMSINVEASMWEKMSAYAKFLQHGGQSHKCLGYIVGPTLQPISMTQRGGQNMSGVLWDN
jgi:hypothetical protein